MEGIDNMSTPTLIDIIVSSVLIVACIVMIFLTIKRKVISIVLTAELLLIPALYFNDYHFASYILMIIFTITTFLTYLANIGEIRKFLINPVVENKGAINLRASKNIDRDKLNKDITDAVKWLSDNKTGALITFERGESLDKYIKTGTIINAPVSAELIETIFYEGTRLHDGAIVIRDDTIVAASVFFTATTKYLVGKYGARHRAAIGVSETTDSLTIIVSEETGRISVAYSGMLESIKYDEFAKVFKTFMLAPSGTISRPTRELKEK